MMDAKLMGKFISELRKENNMTQAQLAKELQVSDKAVSRWERGLGFPDIGTPEPLAIALNINVLELMQCKRMPATDVQFEVATDAVYECKGYSTDEWIGTAFPYDAAMLWREINVTDIPEGWESEYEWNN